MILFAVLFMIPMVSDDFVITLTLTIPLDDTFCLLEVIRILVCSSLSLFIVYLLYLYCFMYLFETTTITRHPA